MEGIDFFRRRAAGECDAEVSERLGGGSSGNGGSSCDSRASMSCGVVRVRSILGLASDSSDPFESLSLTRVVCGEIGPDEENDAGFTSVVTEEGWVVRPRRDLEMSLPPPPQSCPELALELWTSSKSPDAIASLNQDLMYC